MLLNEEAPKEVCDSKVHNEAPEKLCDDELYDEEVLVKACDSVVLDEIP